jgi:hypothetical protein
LGELFHRLVRGAGLPAIRLHDLRHGAASLPSLELGTPPHVVQAIARHADLDVTMRIYAHTNLDTMREALAAYTPPDRLGHTMGCAEIGRELGDAGGPLLVGATALTLPSGLLTLAATLPTCAAALDLTRLPATPTDVIPTAPP